MERREMQSRKAWLPMCVTEGMMIVRRDVQPRKAAVGTLVPNKTSGSFACPSTIRISIPPTFHTAVP